MCETQVLKTRLHKYLTVPGQMNISAEFKIKNEIKRPNYSFSNFFSAESGSLAAFEKEYHILPYDNFTYTTLSLTDTFDGTRILRKFSLSFEYMQGS